MSLFGNILSKIFPKAHPAVASAAAAAAGATPAPATAAKAGTTVPAQPVDVDAILSAMAQKHSEKLNWRTSIVDLLKLLDLDSSASARKALAQELNYTGDPNDSPSMNIWLQKQVMKKLAENGGKVPEDLKH